jgi:hypothetical protein
MVLFEQLRREYEFGIGTIAGIAAKFGVHRRMVRQAIAGALPPPHRYPARAKPKLHISMRPFHLRSNSALSRMAGIRASQPRKRTVARHASSLFLMGSQDRPLPD